MPDQESNLLIIFLDEPIPGKVNTGMIEELGVDEATRRHRAMIAVLLQQLEGLNNTRVRFCYAPEDAGEAVSFWVLPQLRGHVIKRGDTFLYTPERNAQAFTIEFTAQGEGSVREKFHRASQQAFADGYQKVAIMEADCIHCGSRWINAAFLQTREKTCTIGKTSDGDHYLIATHSCHPELFTESSKPISTIAAEHGLNTFFLPPLNRVNTPAAWTDALESSIGGKLRAAIKKES